MSINQHTFTGTVSADALDGTAVSSSDTTGSTVVKRSGGGFSAGTITASSLSGTAVSSTDTTGSTVVKRSGGNFSAGTITASLSGTATNATTAASATKLTASQSGINDVRYVAGVNTIGSSPWDFHYSQYWYFRGQHLINPGNDARLGLGGVPICPLDIRISEELTGGSSHRDFMWNQALTYYSYEVDDMDTSIYCSHWIVSQKGFVAIQNAISSDERIKMDIQDIPDGESLNKLRQIEPKAYYYRDKFKAPHRRTFGFIAQQVENIIPEAVMTKKDYIPNILDLSTVSESNIITFSNFNTSNLLSNTSHLRLTGSDGIDHDVIIVEVIDDKSVRVNTDLSEWLGSVDENGKVNTETGNNIFVRGERVDDFKILDTNYIWTVATAALQEVDRQLQAEKTKVSTLQSQLTSVLARLDALESA